MKREAGVRVPLPEAWLRQPLVRAASPAGACARPACHLPGLVQRRVSHRSPGLPPTPHSGPAHLLRPPTCSRPSRPALLRFTRQVQGTSSSHVFRPKALRPRHLVTARSPPSRSGPSTSSARCGRRPDTFSPLGRRLHLLPPGWAPATQADPGGAAQRPGKSSRHAGVPVPSGPLPHPARRRSRAPRLQDAAHHGVAPGHSGPTLATGALP